MVIGIDFDGFGDFGDFDGFDDAGDVLVLSLVLGSGMRCCLGLGR